jgi:hypothetical protein
VLLNLNLLFNKPKLKLDYNKDGHLDFNSFSTKTNRNGHE